MKEQLKLGFLELKDVQRAVAWLNETRNNEFNPCILNYPTLRVLCAYNGVPVGVLPIQQVLVLESLGLNPDSRIPDQAQAIRDLVKGAQLYASSLGIKEIHFLGTDESVISIAESHGFERIPWSVLRMRL